MSRKLDAAIAGALGYEVEWWKPEDIRFPELILRHADYYLKNTHKDIVPKYSTDSNAMLKLCEEMQKRGFVFYVGFYRGARFACQFFEKTEWVDVTKLKTSCASTMPRVVALAAYYALTGKEWSE